MFDGYKSVLLNHCSLSEDIISNNKFDMRRNKNVITVTVR